MKRIVYIDALDSRGYTLAAWGGTFALMACAMVAAQKGEWRRAAVFGSFSLACAAFAVWNTPQPRLLKALFVVTAALNAAGWAWHLYRTVPGYDEVAHGFTSFTLTFCLAFIACRPEGVYFRSHPLLLCLMVVSVALALGAIWEVVELAAGVVETRFNAVDDLATDAIGAMIAAPLAVWGVRHRCGSG